MSPTVHIDKPPHRAGLSPSGFRTLTLIVSICCAVRPALSQRGRTFVHERDTHAPSLISEVVPQWHGRLLIAVEPWAGKDLMITAVSGEGHSEQIPFALPESSWIQTVSIGAGLDRSIVLGGIARSADSRGTAFVAWISPDRTRRTVIRTGKFFPFAVAVAADGAVWAAGHEAQDEDFQVWTYNLFRRYSVSGELLSAFGVPQASAKTMRNNTGDATEASWLLPSPNRVGWFTNGGEYFEFSLTGAVTKRFDEPPGFAYMKSFAGAALSDANELVVGLREGAAASRLSILDRQTGSWTALALAGEDTPGRLLGFDGDALVTQSTDGTLHRFRAGESLPAK